MNKLIITLLFAISFLGCKKESDKLHFFSNDIPENIPIEFSK